MRRPVRGALLLVLLLVSPAPGRAVAESVGAPPVAELGFRDVTSAFALPALKDAPSGPLAEAGKLQVIVRARRLGLGGHSAVDAWRNAGDQLAAARQRVEAAREALRAGPQAFAGTRVSELNRFLTTSGLKVRVVSSRLVADEPLRIGRDGLALDLGRTELAATDPRQPYAARIEHVQGVRLLGGEFSGMGSGVLIHASRDVVVADGRFTDLSGEGVVVTGAEGVVVWGDRFSGVGRAGILLHGATTGSVVAENEIADDHGASNWHAGVVVTDRSADLAANPLNLFQSDGYWTAPQPIVQRLAIPRRNLVAYNRILRNRASGIYFDGAVENLVVGNVIQGNAKEGMCLDNGSTANVVALNTIQQNGARWGSSDEDLKRDFIAGFGRLPDGTAVAKVPGLSLDNAAYNLVYGNDIDGNFGGGVKMVRTGYFNVVGMNTIVDNNRGHSDRFHFFGVELGAAGADAPAIDLDFTPSRGNIIFSNLVRGSHYAGVFFAPGSDLNDLFDNAIFGASNWAIESATKQNNSTLNNLTNLPSRNIGPGLDPRLAAFTAAHYD